MAQRPLNLGDYIRGSADGTGRACRLVDRWLSGALVFDASGAWEQELLLVLQFRFHPVDANVKWKLADERTYDISVHTVRLLLLPCVRRHSQVARACARHPTRRRSPTTLHEPTY